MVNVSRFWTIFWIIVCFPIAIIYVLFKNDEKVKPRVEATTDWKLIGKIGLALLMALLFAVLIALIIMKF